MNDGWREHLMLLAHRAPQTSASASIGVQSMFALGEVYWVLMLFWLCFGCWSYWPAGGGGAFVPFGGNLLLFFIIAILGWHVFGPPFH
jgi:hypothetical protein